jgi:hypothetical protein
MISMAGFPQHVIGPGHTLWRIHGSTHGPWFFRDDGLFRFDLRGRPGWGTCYFAEDPLGAFVETLQNFRTVPLPRAELVNRKVYAYDVGHALVLADVTTNQAGGFGVDASASASSGGYYAGSQALAVGFFDAGFAGIRYRVRHDLSQDLIGIALFGPAGPQPDNLLDGQDHDIGEALVTRACKETYFRTQGPLLDPA